MFSGESISEVDADLSEEAYDLISDVLDTGEFTNADVISAIGMLLAMMIKEDETDPEETFNILREIVVDELKRNCDA